MKTYLVVWFDSEGATPSRVISRLTSLGFNPVTGEYDFEYSWPKKPSMDEMFDFFDRVHMTLKGMKVNYKIESE